MENNKYPTARKVRVVTTLNANPEDIESIRQSLNGDNTPSFTSAHPKQFVNREPKPEPERYDEEDEDIQVAPNKPLTDKAINSKGQRIDRLNIEKIKAQFAVRRDEALEITPNNEAEVNESTHNHYNNEKPSTGFDFGKQRITDSAPEDTDFTYHRIEFPSNHTFYNSEFFLRALSPEDLIDLSPARKPHPVTKSYNQTLMLDVFNRTMKNMDIRDLHIGDFRFLFYWLKLNSYTRTPMTFNFMSKYGNKNKVTIKTSDISIETIDSADKEKLYEYMERGFTFPTLRDGEEFEKFLFSKPEGDREKLEYVFSYVQFIPGNSIEDKVKKFSKLSPDDMVDIIEFSTLLNNYGVVEKITVRDQHFEPNKAIEFLEKELEAINSIDLSEINNDKVYDALVENQEELNKEIERIKQQLSTSGEAVPSDETITFYLELENLFPENLATRTIKDR